MTQWLNLSISQFFQQRPRFSQILRAKPLSEPAIDLGQHLVSFFPFALALPQAGETDRRTQFQGLGLLLLSNINGLQKACFGFALGIGGQGSGFSIF